MKLAKLILLLLVSAVGSEAYAQCLNDNTFLMDATPPPNTGVSTSAVNCIDGGEYVTVNVVAGNTYTFSTCGNTAFDTQITVLNAATSAVIGYNDNDCGLQSTVTWVATFSGTVNVLVDEFNCSNTGLCTDLTITSDPPTQTGTGCNTNTTICQSGTAGPFNFGSSGPQVSSCLDFFGPSYAYIVLYITQSGPLQLLIDGNAGTGFIDVAIFDVPPGVDPCVASLNNMNEISCNYATAASGCNQIGTYFPCASSIASPNVTAGDVLFIIAENWSGTSNNFTMQLGPPPAAQTGPPDATITPVTTLCNTDPAIQLNAVDNGGTWSGPGVSASGLFDPSTVAPGTYTINYTIGTAPCNDADQTTITVIDCNCLITNFSANVSACEAATNTFTVDGDFTYQGNPGTGTVIVEVTNGSGTYTQTFTSPFVDGQLYNYSISGVPSDGTPLTVTVYFSDDIACTAVINSTSPASCACNVDIGTFSVSTTGTQTGNDFVLCFGDDLDITANGDFVPPGEATNPPGPPYTPGIGWLIYSCPPTVALAPDPVLTIPDDPCLIGILPGPNLNETNDMFWINAYPPGTFTNNTVYFVPLSIYSTTNSPQIYSYTNTTMPCYETGNVYSVQYIPEITEVSVEDCTTGSVTTTVSGGQPSMDGSLFTGTNLVPATASFAPGTATDGGDIVVTGLIDGDVYSYDIVDASGCPITVTGTFVGLEDPAFTYPQTAYCQDDANPTPTITGDAGGTFSSTAGISLNPTTGLVNLAASTPGTYTITYQTPDPICFATATFDITINPLPIVDGNDETICAGDVVVLNGTGADSYVWDNGVVDGVGFTPAATTTYTVTGTITATGCSNTGTATVTVSPLPTATIAGTITVCEGDVAPTITFTGANGTAPYTFTYNINGGANQTVVSVGNTATVAAPTGTAGTFDYNLLSVSDAGVNACSQAQPDVATVTVNPLPTATIVGTATVCQNDVGPTITFTGANGTAPYTFTYNINGGANQTVTSVGNTATLTAPTGTVGTFDYNLVSVSGASATACSQAQVDAATITILPNSTATIDGTIDVCLGDAEPVITFTGADGTAPYTFTYNINNTGDVTVVSVGNTATITIPTIAAGTFNVNLVSVSDASASGCTLTQAGTATVTVNDLPVVSAGNDITICEGDQTALTASGAVNYVWDQGVVNGVLFTPSASGTYTVIGTDANGCSNTDEVDITLEPAPVVSFVGDILSGCEPLEVTFTNTTPGNLTDCVWILGDGTVITGCGSITHTYTAAGTYDVTLTTTSATGCTASATYLGYVYVEGNPTASFTPSETDLTNLNSEVYFENTSSGAMSYEWDFGDASPGSTEVSPIHIYPIDASGTYTVELIAYSPLGCSDTAYAEIRLTEELIFYVPNTFTPDDDDYNPTFQPVFSSGFDPYDFRLLIFNRWGEIIFESQNAAIGWDGTYGGKLMQDGTYTWKIEFKTTANDERKVVTGHVNMIK